MNSTRLTEYVAVAATFIGGALWLGAQGNEIQNIKAAQVDLKTVPADIAVLKVKAEQTQQTLDEIKKLLEKTH
jgi:ketopantoate reductase